MATWDKVKTEVPHDPLREALKLSRLYEYNENHDAQGRFAAGGGGGASAGTKPKASVPSSAEEFYKQNPHSWQPNSNFDIRAAGFDALPDDADVWVYHGTDNASADSILKQGIVPGAKPKTKTGTDRFGPGMGLSDFTYVASDPMNAIGYGKRVLAIKVKKRDVEASPEILKFGKRSAGTAIARSDAVVRGKVSPADIVDVSQHASLNFSHDVLSKTVSGD